MNKLKNYIISLVYNWEKFGNKLAYSKTKPVYRGVDYNWHKQKHIDTGDYQVNKMGYMPAFSSSTIDRAEASYYSLRN